MTASPTDSRLAQRHAAAGPGRLSLVATPIGNLADITLRALDTLRAADLVLAEDTRRSRVLLQHHGIDVRLVSLHEHNERARMARVLEELAAGRRVALVSDAGMPGISDPGALLVAEVAAREFTIEVIPGPSAVTAAVALAGFPTERFAFEGFLPAKKNERRRRLQAVAGDDRALVFFEAPHRIVAALRDMLEVLGDRRATAARELTKKHEEARRGTLAALLASFEAETPRGEITLVVAGAIAGVVPGDTAPGVPARPSDDALRREIDALMTEKGLSRRDALREVAARYGLARQFLYRLFA